MTHKKGFTLIELLVVIAIIGILSGIVLASLNQARFKGDDGAVRANMMSLRSQAHLYYDDNGNSYGTNAAFESDCAAADNLFADPTIVAQIAAVTKANTGLGVTCNVAADGIAYAVSAALVATPGTYYCVDSENFATTTTTALGTATACQ